MNHFKIFLIVGLAVMNFSCGRGVFSMRPLPSGGGDAGGGTGGGGPSGPTFEPVTGSYCLVSQQSGDPSPSGAFSLQCLQSDGTWKAVGGSIETLSKCGQADDERGFYGSNVFQSSNGELFVGYTKCGGYPEAQLVVRRYDPVSGWVPVSSSGVNSGVQGFYSQFGAAYHNFSGKIMAFWTTGSQGRVSLLDSSGNWNHLTLPTGDALIRHPQFFQTNDKIYVHYGQPSPAVWDVTDGTAVSTGVIPQEADRYTLHSSLSVWQGKLVLAFTSSDYPVFKNWYIETDTVKVAFSDGTGNWSISSASVQDTPGHDGGPPFLFVIQDELYIMYPDYTTPGVPTDYQYLPMRLRVKKWNGSAWVPQGTESETIMLPQRVEYLLDGDQVLFTAIRPITSQPFHLERLVLLWKGGTFSQLGNTVDTNSYWMFRPGSLVRIQ